MKPWSYKWLEFGLFSTIIAIIRACACWALFVVTLTNTVHLIDIYTYIYIYRYILCRSKVLLKDGSFRSIMWLWCKVYETDVRQPFLSLFATYFYININDSCTRALMKDYRKWFFHQCLLEITSRDTIRVKFWCFHQMNNLNILTDHGTESLLKFAMNHPVHLRIYAQLYLFELTHRSLNI